MTTGPSLLLQLLGVVQFKEMYGYLCCDGSSNVCISRSKTIKIHGLAHGFDKIEVCNNINVSWNEIFLFPLLRELRPSTNEYGNLNHEHIYMHRSPTINFTVLWRWERNYSEATQSEHNYK